VVEDEGELLCFDGVLVKKSVHCLSGVNEETEAEGGYALDSKHFLRPFDAGLEEDSNKKVVKRDFSGVERGCEWEGVPRCSQGRDGNPLSPRIFRELETHGIANGQEGSDGILRWCIIVDEVGGWRQGLCRGRS
jgi:hypothetical protein